MAVLDPGVQNNVVFKQRDSLKPRTVTENGGTNIHSTVKTTSSPSFLLRTLRALGLWEGTFCSESAFWKKGHEYTVRWS